MMRFLIVAIIVLGFSTAFANEVPAQLPQDVSSFIEKRDLCDHFRGEDPYDEERRAFLEENLVKFCTGTDAALAELKQKYHNNPSIMDVLNRYEDKIETSGLMLNK
jgi:hypothetical protein